MDLRRAAMMSVCVVALTAGHAAAQAPWPPPQQATAPWPAQQPQQAAPSTFGPSQPSAPAPFGPSPSAPAPFGPSAHAPSGFGAPPQQQAQQPPPCIQEFLKLRDQAQKRANAIRIASEKKQKPSAQEACALFNAFSAAEIKMLKYATDNSKSCGIPQDIIANIKGGHAKTNEIRTKVCEAAARPAQPAAPSLSDALVMPAPDKGNIRAGGGGAFDTLSGSALGRQ